MAAKILLVEDDKSLREIYGVRLQAEGYDIVSANDGEQALAVAIKERPSLIITDVMMPKISGFDMLDILRSTAETKEIKVIMMTALSSDDQRSRGERMGADRYLVKSQVGIEDVVRTVHEVLGDSGASATPAAAAPAPDAPAPVPTPAGPSLPVPPAPSPDVPRQSPPPVSPTPPVAPEPPAVPDPAPPPVPPTSSVPDTPSAKQRIIQPLNDPSAKVDINDLLDKELAKEAGLDPASRPQIASTEQEKAAVQDQIQAAEQAAPTPPAVPEPPAPTAPPAPAAPAVPPAPTQLRPASPTVPPRNASVQAPPRIPTI